MSPTLAARRARRFLYMSMAVGISVLLMGLGYAVAAILTLTQEVRDTQLEGTPLGRQLQRSADRILDCTESQGECYKRNQRNQADAIGNINRVAVLAAACAAGLPDGLSDQRRVFLVQNCLITQLAVEARDE